MWWFTLFITTICLLSFIPLLVQGFRLVMEPNTGGSFFPDLSTPLGVFLILVGLALLGTGVWGGLSLIFA